MVCPAILEPGDDQNRVRVRVPCNTTNSEPILMKLEFPMLPQAWPWYWSGFQHYDVLSYHPRRHPNKLKSEFIPFPQASRWRFISFIIKLLIPNGYDIYFNYFTNYYHNIYIIHHHHVVAASSIIIIIFFLSFFLLLLRCFLFFFWPQKKISTTTY